MGRKAAASIQRTVYSLESRRDGCQSFRSNGTGFPFNNCGSLYPFTMLELDGVQEFDAATDSAFFSALPSHPGVLLVEMSDPGAEPYLARTADLRRAAERLLRLLILPPSG